jgi:hypothetical protein
MILSSTKHALYSIWLCSLAALRRSSWIMAEAELLGLDEILHDSYDLVEGLIPDAFLLQDAFATSLGSQHIF